MAGGSSNDLNGAKAIERLERLERYSLRAGHIRQHRNKHQSQIQTSEILDLCFRPFLNLSFIPSPLSFQIILHPFAFILFMISLGLVRFRLHFFGGVLI